MSAEERCPVHAGRPFADGAANPPLGCPTTDHDLYSAESLLAPYEHYRALRDQGGVVFLSRYGLYALPRYDSTRTALSDWKHFSSQKGVMLNTVMDEFMHGSLLCSDPPEHDILRSVIMRPLTPKALRGLQPEITNEAESLVARLCAQGSFNAATELAQHLPVTIVSNRVGLPPVEKGSMLRWTPAAFDCAGPIEAERTQASFPILAEIGGFVQNNGARSQVAKDSWLEGLYQAADEGIIPHERCAGMSIDYIGPALDTTISATSAAIYLFATNPDQWDRIRAQPSLIPNAINEVVRLESPIQGWGRRAAENCTIDGITIPAGAKVLVMFGSANRDERKWDDAEKFDVTRKVTEHLGFGFGEHSCAGANLARMEMTALLTALAKRPEEDRIRCPLLVLHGGSDPLIGLADQQPFLDASETTDATLRIWPDGEHTIYNHAAERTAFVSDWFAERLVGG